MKFYLTIMLLLILFVSQINANVSYQDVSPKIIVYDAQIILKGKIVRIKYGALAAHSMDTGVIAVKKILKGENANNNNAEVNLVFSGKNREKRSAIDITFDSGAEGIWMLKKIINSNTRVFHPDCFQPISTEPIINHIVNKKSLNELKDLLANANDDEKLLITKLFRFEGAAESISLLINLLNEQNSKIVSNAREGLLRMTNQIIIDKDELAQNEKKELIKGWQKWWQENKKKSRDDWIKSGIERDVSLLINKDENIRKRAADRLIVFTGQYGFVGTEFRPNTPEAIGKWERWWPENRSKSLKDLAIALIDSPDPDHRVHGVQMIFEMIKFGDEQLISYLIKALMDPYPVVTEQAIYGLYSLTGEKFGFDSQVSQEKNLEPIKQWMEWSKKNKFKKKN
ncbi:hypothetical protein HZA55_08095 [Candidatus Poribacteria bacterium]|nr:hypothetical protein [Candidatus Poribacteria bacterium]